MMQVLESGRPGRGMLEVQGVAPAEPRDARAVRGDGQVVRSDGQVGTRRAKPTDGADRTIGAIGAVDAIGAIGAIGACRS
jgi:hypothetical protein